MSQLLIICIFAKISYYNSCTEKAHDWYDLNNNKESETFDKLLSLFILPSWLGSLHPLGAFIMSDDFNDEKHYYVAHDDICEWRQVAKKWVQVILIIQILQLRGIIFHYINYLSSKDTDSACQGYCSKHIECEKHFILCQPLWFPQTK